MRDVFWEAIEAEAPSLDEVFPKDYKDIPEPKAQGKEQAMKAITSIYIAGKMQTDDWRDCLFDSGEKYGRELRLDPALDNLDEWPEYSEHLVCGLRYTGPFFVDLCGGHGFHPFEGCEHGCNINQGSEFSSYNHSKSLSKRRNQVQSWCFDAIKRADLVFAWIDTVDCYGTIAELGYAKALGKIIWIAGPELYHDLWFVYEMANEVAFASNNANKSPDKLFRWMFNTIYRQVRCFDSPIEQKFWDEWVRMGCHNDLPLIPQYPIGKYRVDFAHLSTKTAIELDGFATHSSTDAIAYDRKRQREIEDEGWHVIRFGGKEVHLDVFTCADTVIRRILKHLSK